MSRLHVTRASRRRPRRLGAILSMEMVMVLPILFGLLLAMIEFGMLWISGQRVKEAATAGGRTASFRAADEAAVRRSVEQGLGKKSLIESYTLNVEHNPRESNDVSVTVAVPMKSAAPDLLRFLGFGLADRTITARTVLRKE